MPDALQQSYARSRAAGRATLREEPATGLDATRLLVAAVGPAIGEGGSWFALAEGLLIILTRMVVDWNAVLDEQGGPDCLDAVDECAVAFTEAVGPALSGAVGVGAATRIGHVLDEEEDAGTADVLVVAGLLKAIDREHNQTFTDWAAAEEVVTIEPGAAYPVARRDPTPLMAESANTRPDHLPSLSLPAVARHIRLGEDIHSTYRVTLDWSLAPHLATLADRQIHGDGPRRGRPASLRVATAHVHESWTEFTLVDGAQPGSVRNEGPTDGEGSASVHGALVRLACAPSAGGVAHADVVLIPEYTVTDTGRAAVASELADGQGPTLVVAGSAISAGGTNEGHVLVRSTVGTTREITVDGLVSATTEKFTRAKPFGIPEDLRGTGRPSITVWRSGDLAVAVLICRDGADGDAIGLLARAGVNLCLVPSFTDRLASLAQSIGRLATEAQTWIAVGAAPRVVDDEGRVHHEAFFTGPFGDDVLMPSVFAPRAPDDGGHGPPPPLPGLWVFDSRDIADLDDDLASAAGPRVRFVALRA